MTAPPRPTGTAVRLGVMLLEERTPASTTLDVLLPGLMLPVGTSAEPTPTLTAPPTPVAAAPATAAPQPAPRADDTVPATGRTAEPVVTTDPTRGSPLDLDPVGFGPFGHLTFAVTLTVTPTAAADAGQSTAAQPGVARTVSTANFAAPADEWLKGAVGRAVMTVNYGPPTPPTYPPPSPPTYPQLPPVTLKLSLPDTAFVPVNANDDSRSPWRTDANGTPQIGLPRARDFDVYPMRDLSGWTGAGPMPTGGPYFPDPELKRLHIDYTGPTREMVLQIIYPNGPSGVVRLWKEPTKETVAPLYWNADHTVMSGQLPLVPPGDLWVEGLEPSRAVRDVTIRVQFVHYMQGDPPDADDRVRLTVTPVLTSFTVTPKTPPKVDLLYTPGVNGGGGGQVLGLNSGRQATINNDPSSNSPGFLFHAETNPRTSLPGRPYFVQVISAGGPTPQVSLTNGGGFNLVPVGGASYPLLGPANANPGPQYSENITTNTPDVAVLDDADTPYVARSQWDTPDAAVWSDKIAGINITYNAILLLVWKYPDGSLYTLALINWQVVFAVSSSVPGQPVRGTTAVIPNTAVASADTTFTRTHADPSPVTGPRFNSSITWQ